MERPHEPRDWPPDLPGRPRGRRGARRPQLHAGHLATACGTRWTFLSRSGAGKRAGGGCQLGAEDPEPGLGRRPRLPDPCPRPAPRTLSGRCLPAPSLPAACLGRACHLGLRPGRPDRAPRPRPGTSSAQSPGRAIECAPASWLERPGPRLPPSDPPGTSARAPPPPEVPAAGAAGRAPPLSRRAQRGVSGSVAAASAGRPGLGCRFRAGRPGCEPGTRCQSGASGAGAQRRRLSAPPACCTAAPGPPRPASKRRSVPA